MRHFLCSLWNIDAYKLLNTLCLFHLAGFSVRSSQQELHLHVIYGNSLNEFGLRTGDFSGRNQYQFSVISEQILAIILSSLPDFGGESSRGLRRDGSRAHIFLHRTRTKVYWPRAGLARLCCWGLGKSWISRLCLANFNYICWNMLYLPVKLIQAINFRKDI